MKDIRELRKVPVLEKEDYSTIINMQLEEKGEKYYRNWYQDQTSGTTGKPKCIVHSVGGTLLQHLKEHQLHCDIGPHDRIFYFTTCGWMMWNWVVSSLAAGAAVVLYEGSPFHPSPAAMFDLIDDLGITIYGTGAKAIAAWEKAGLRPRETHELNTLVTLLSTGSPLAPESPRSTSRTSAAECRAWPTIRMRTSRAWNARSRRSPVWSMITAET